MIEYIVDVGGGSFSDRHEAKLHAAGFAERLRVPVVVTVVVDSEQSAWEYGGPAGLEAFQCRRCSGPWSGPVEIDSLTEHPPSRTLD